MASIYNIQEELFDIFNQIEENEGELTPELEEALSIKQEEFENKIKSYSCVVRQLECDLNAIKEEKARLDTLKKSKEKTIERLKKIMAEAINLFGDTSKTGTKFIDYGTGKVSLRNTTSVEVDEESVKNFTNRFILYFKHMNFCNTLDQLDTEKDIINHCNNFISNDNDECLNISVEDLTNLDADFTVKANLADLLRTEDGLNLIKTLARYKNNFTAKPNISKNELKNLDKLPSFTNINTKQSVIIK